MESGVYKQFYEFEKDHWWSKGMRFLCKRMVDRYCKERDGALILDIGCGTGELTHELDKNMPGVIGADMSSEAVEFCRKRAVSTLVMTKAEATGFKGGSFSAVIAFCLMEHISDDALFLAEMHRILKPGGHLIIVTSAFQFLWSKHDEIAHHKRRYRLSVIKRLLKERGFRIRKATYINSAVFPAVLVIRIVQRLFGLGPKSNEGFMLDLVKLPGAVNEILYGLLKTEARALDYINFPVGVGILCVVEK